MSSIASCLILALDFGGTKNSAAVFEQGVRTWRGVEREFSSHPTGDSDRSTMLRLADRLLAGRTPSAVGVSFGGPVRASKGWVKSDHVSGWDSIPLALLLSERFRAPVVVDNDANVAALGEARFGAGQGATSLLYVTVSTGVGGGWILDGQIWRGYDEMAGEIGHLTVDPDGPVCICGRRGCVEIIACGPAIARAARERLAREFGRGRLIWERAGNDPDRITAQLVNQAALDGDPLAAEIMHRAARALGLGIGSAIELMNPARVVVGGGVSKSGERYFETVRAAARENCRRELTVDIVPTALGDDAPLWGAVALATDLLER